MSAKLEDILEMDKLATKEFLDKFQDVVNLCKEYKGEWLTIPPELFKRKESMEQLKERIIDLLVSTEREGIHELINYLDEAGYFESPASTKHHGVKPGGLAEHSLLVMQKLHKLSDEVGMNLPVNTIKIAALLHDVCKVGQYIPTNNGYIWNKSSPPGHGSLSVSRIKQYIDLTELEEKMILYHMGVYECHEFDGKGEYPLRGDGLIKAWNDYPAVKLMYICDELATMQEKGSQ